MPLDGVDIEAIKGGFTRRRDGHPHEAVDLFAPRNSPVHVVEDAMIAKLFFSKGAGGNTIYQFDPTSRFCYYYAHLERYAAGLREGQNVGARKLAPFIANGDDYNEFHATVSAVTALFSYALTRIGHREVVEMSRRAVQSSLKELDR